MRIGSTIKSQAEFQTAARRGSSEDSMKRVFLLIVVPALLVALGFAQTPTASSNTDQSNIKGCLGGSDGNYTLAEDNTGQTFKLTASGVDLKPHLGHDVKLIGNKASGAASSGAADNSFAVIALSMISEHCGAAAAAPAATVSTPAETAIAPAVPAAATANTTASTPAEPAAANTTVNAPATTAAATPDATVNTPAAPTATDSRPAMAAAVPDTTVSAPPASTAAPDTTAITPPAPAAAVAAAGPDTTVKKSSDIDGAPAASAPQPTRPSARTRRAPATPAVVATPVEIVSTPVIAAAAPAATVSTPAETSTTPAAAATNPATTASGGSLWVLVSVVVLVLVLGALVPLVNRWRKRKLLEQTSAQNLSFTHEASSDRDKSDKPDVRKAA